MHILLTNDDGIDAPGLRALAESVAFAFGTETLVTVVAPDRQRSECGHSVTNGRALSLKEHQANWFSVDGTPVDCVRVALGTIAPAPAMVLSGINAGANLGVDLLCSGTYAAAREAALHEIPAMAVSHYRRPDVPHTWDHTPKWLVETLIEFRTHVRQSPCDSSSQPPLLWNVNLPAIDPASDPPPRRRCVVDGRPIARTTRQNGATVAFDVDFHARPRDANSDVDHCFSGMMTISENCPRP